MSYAMCMYKYKYKACVDSAFNFNTHPKPEARSCRSTLYSCTLYIDIIIIIIISQHVVHHHNHKS